MRTVLRKCLRLLGRRSGQVEVETAIVLPAVTFLMLGLIQLGLLHQARLMAKYAAYQAVRKGSMWVKEGQTAWIDSMQETAVAAALPVLSDDTDPGRDGGEVLRRSNDVASWIQKWNLSWYNGNMMNDVHMPYAEVTICGPLRDDVSGFTYTAGGKEFFMFDHPDLSGGDALKAKLRIELTLNYRMIIPFADWVIYYMYRGWKFTKDLHLGEGEQDAPPAGGDKYDTAAIRDKVYIIPLVAQYAMRLHSDVPVNNLPTSNNCK